MRSRGASLRPLTQLQNQKMLQVKKISFDNPALYIEKQKYISNFQESSIRFASSSGQKIMAIRRFGFLVS